MDEIYRNVLRKTYKMFRFFHGTFETNLKGGSKEDQRQHLSNVLTEYLTSYLEHLKLPSVNFFNILQSVQYFPLQKDLFLRLHNFIKVVKATFPSIDYCSYFFNDHIVWSEIASEDLNCLHDYLTTILFPKAIKAEISSGAVERNYLVDCDRCGGFLAGQSSSENTMKPPVLYLHERNGSLKMYSMIVYRTMNGTLCLFVDGEFFISLFDCRVNAHKRHFFGIAWKPFSHCSKPVLSFAEVSSIDYAALTRS